MTIRRIFFASFLIAGIPFLYTSSNAQVLSDSVAVDDVQVNPKDFPETVDTKSVEEDKPTIVIACGQQVCKPDN